MTDEMSAKKTALWKDSLLLASELAARNVYWRVPRLRAWLQRRRAHRQPTPQVADRQQLKEYLRSIGVVDGALVMAHTSMSGLKLTSNSKTILFPPNGEQGTPSLGEKSMHPLLVAEQLVGDLVELVGATGTLVMPTHAAYQTPESNTSDADLRTPILYDPAKTPCSVGLVNELFRRRKGVKRSLYPYNMVAAYGPLTDELLRDNLNSSKPLPHGVHSAYYRFCQRNGLVISIGIPLGGCMTLVHTAEDVRDEAWPVKEFFEEKRYLVRMDGRDEMVVVRHQRPEYAMFCRSQRKCIRDLVGEGILHEGMVGSVRVDWARSKEVFDYLMCRNENRPYPFYCTWLVRN